MDLAKYHEICRFTEDGTYDKVAALFHLRCAAECGLVAAITALAKMYCGLPHDDVLTEVEPPEEDEEEKKKIGFYYMEEAAKAGDRSSMVFVARAYDSGLNLVDASKKSAKAAIDWYEKICEVDALEGDSSIWGMDDAPYMLMARQAEIWLAGDEDLPKDPNRSGDLYNEAAESAMNSMKGKLANKYYMKAEEAYAECEEE